MTFDRRQEFMKKIYSKKESAWQIYLSTTLTSSDVWSVGLEERSVLSTTLSGIGVIIRSHNGSVQVNAHHLDCRHEIILHND